MPFDFNDPIDSVRLAWYLSGMIFQLDFDDWMDRTRRSTPELSQNLGDWTRRDSTLEAPRCVKVNDLYWTLILIQGVKRNTTALRLFEAYGQRPEQGLKAGLNAQVKRGATELQEALAPFPSHTRGGILIAGHSYGGACAQALGSFIKADQPEKEVRVITFGAPRPGTHHWCQANQSLQHYRYWNDDDPIRLISPRRNEAPAAHSVLPPRVGSYWHEHDHIGNAVMVQPEGNVVRRSVPAGEIVLTEVNLVGWASGIMQAPVMAHSIFEYNRRLGLAVDRGMSLGTDRPGTTIRARRPPADPPTPIPQDVPQVVAQVQAVQAAVIAERTTPLPREYAPQRNGDTWAVYHGNDFVTYAATRARAARIARVANEMQRSATLRGVDISADIRRVVASLL